MPFQRIHTILLSIICLLFIVLYSILSFNNRLPYEDYILISVTKEVGSIKAMMNIYYAYCARWSAHTLAFCFSQFYENKIFLAAFNLISFSILITSFFLLIKKILNGIYFFHINNKFLLLYSILLTCCLFFSSYDIGQTWFWYMVNWVYVWSIIAGNFLLWILLHEKLKLSHIPFIIILTAYIAGAAESYSTIYILFLLTMFIIKKKNIACIFTEKIAPHSLLISLTLLVLFYMITIFSPGTWGRIDGLTHATFIQHCIMVMKAYGIVILKLTPKLIPYLILFGLPWMILGQTISSNNKIEIKKILPSFIKSILLIGSLILILILPASWILYDLPPARALSQISLLLSVYTSCFFFYIGHKIQITKKIIDRIIFFSSTASVCVLCFHIMNQHSITSNFSNEYDKRIEYVTKKNNSGRKNTAFIDPLPASSMIYSDELSTDSLSNIFFEKVYGLNFHLAVKSEDQHKK